MTKISKVCTKCKIEKPITDFQPLKTRKGTATTQPRCKKCAYSDHVIMRNRKRIEKNKATEIKTIDGEIWLPIKNYEGYYEVSNLARVRSLPREKMVFGRVVILRSRLLHQVRAKNGYFNVMVSVKSEIKNLSVHRMVAFAFVPNPDNLPEINHKDGDKGNNHASNLEWITRKGNVKHANDNGLIDYPYGQRKPQSRFTDDQVRLIKSVADKMSINETMALLGIALDKLYFRQTICKIRRGKSYQRVV